MCQDAFVSRITRRIFEQAEQIVDEAWKISVGTDFQFEETTGPKPLGTDLFNRYVARLVRRTHTDRVLTEAFFRVFRLERPVTSLLHPGVVWRVLRPRFGATGGESSRRRR